MKTYKIFYTDNAESCLLDISEYIAQDNPIRAKSFINEIVSHLNKTLSIFPLSYPICEDIGYKIRLYPYQKYNCYYWLNTDKQIVEILFIFNSAKNTKGKLYQYIQALK